GSIARSDLAIYGAFALVLIAPFFLFETIPLYDLPNHIARQHILFGDGAEGVAQYYDVHWRPIPNLAMEGFVFLLHRIVSVETAVRIFLALSVVQVFVGTTILNVTLFGRAIRLPLASALFAYSGPLIFGFANCYFGVGSVLWIFALWLRRRRHASS